MPKNILIFFLLYIISLGLQELPATPLEFKQQLIVADNLFAQKKYMESLAIYENLFQSTQQASPSMLMKIAYIYEGLGDYTQALYYLNLHYRYSPSNAALMQMENIAQQHRLRGYERSDVDIFKAVYQRYFMYISIILLLGCTAAFAALLYRKIRHEQILPRYPIILMTLLALVFFLVIFSNESDKAIIRIDHTYLMAAPSAGSKVLAKLSQGHRVEVLGKQDVWTKILWEKKEAFVRESQLLFISDSPILGENLVP